MQDAPNRFVSEEATTAPTRSLGLIGILASLVAFALGMGVWLGVFAGLIFVGALLFDGMASINALIEDFDRFDPLRLGSDVGAQRAMFAGGVLIYLAALATEAACALKNRDLRIERSEIFSSLTSNLIHKFVSIRRVCDPELSIYSQKYLDTA